MSSQKASDDRVSSAHHEEDGLSRGYEVCSHGRAARNCPPCPAGEAHNAAVAVAHARDAVQRPVYTCPVVVPKVPQLQSETELSHSTTSSPQPQ